MRYKREWVDTLAKVYTPVLLEFYSHSNDYAVGYLVRSTYKSTYYSILPLDTSKPVTSFNLSNIKRMIYLSNNVVVPVELHGNHRMTKQLDVFEMNELLKKAGYQQC